MADYAPAVKRLLREHGCSAARKGKGDHEIWYSPKTARHFPVDSKIRSRHTANGILKQAGIPKAFEASLGVAWRHGNPFSPATV